MIIGGGKRTLIFINVLKIRRLRYCTRISILTVYTGNNSVLVIGNDNISII